MTKLTKEGCEFIEKTLVEAAKYSGNQEPGKKQISASQLGDDDLQLYLKYMHGGKDSETFEANTFGSIYHLGAAEAFKDVEDTEVESPLSYMLPNGWLVTGSMDLILHKFKIIADHKTTTATTITNVIKDGKNAGYSLQMGAYKLLVAKNYGHTDYEAVLPVVDKTFSYFKKANKYNQLTFINVETYSLEDIEQMLIDKTNRLQDYIDLGQEPPECSNVFPYSPGKGQRMKRMRCIHYCDQAGNCTAYKEYQKNTYTSNPMEQFGL